MHQSPAKGITQTTVRSCGLVAVFLFASLAQQRRCPAAAQNDVINREPQIKAAYVYKFCFYVTWPKGVFPTNKSPLVIGTVGNDPVNQYLRVIARRRTFGPRKIVCKDVRSIDDAKACHVVFFSDSVKPNVRREVVGKLRQTPLLLIGESSDFINSGGMISFFVTNNRVRFRLSLKRSAAAKLKVSSNLAKIARFCRAPLNGGRNRPARLS